MPIKAPKKAKNNEIEAGMYVARCYSIIHIGTAYSPYLKKDINEIRIGWELPTEMREFKEGADLQPVSQDENYTLSMYKKANLRQVVESWLGKTMSDEEADDYDLMDLLGRPCMLNIAENKRGYMSVMSVSPLIKGVEAPDQINPNKVFNFDDHFTPNPEEVLPEWISDKIKESDEYRNRILELEGAAHEEKVVKSGTDKDEEPPF